MKNWLCKSGWRFFPGLLAASLTLTAANTNILKSFEHGIYRSLFQIRGERPWDDRVTIIEIDETSLAAIGQFPWPRHYYTELLAKLDAAEASVIAFDILFADSTADDAALSKAMAQHGNVVVATAWDERRGVIGPNAGVVEGAIATGHIHHHADADGITRNYDSKINGTSALSVVAVQHYKQTQLDTLTTASTSNQTLWLNWLGFAQSAPRYSFVDVLTGQVSAATFTNKIVFIGYTGAGLDAMTTPYNQNPPAAGVYQHIVAANNLLTQNHLRPIVSPVLVLFMLLSPVLGCGLLYRCYRVHLLTNLTIIIMWTGIVVVAFHNNYWLPTVLPLGTIATTSLFVRLTERLQSKLQQLELTTDAHVLQTESIYKTVVE